MESPYKSNIREEFIVTAVFMVLVITGSFFLVYRSLNQSKQPKLSLNTEADVLGTSKIVEDEVSEVIEEFVAPTNTPIPISTPNSIVKPPATQSANPIPQYGNTVIEQPYGVGGEYQNEKYLISFTNPRLVVSTSRVFKVDVVLSNISVDTGLKNRLSASIIKDGEVIAESAPFSLSESATAYPGEQISYTATMSLISGTDVARIKYLPLSVNIEDTIHDL